MNFSASDSCSARRSMDERLWIKVDWFVMVLHEWTALSDQLYQDQQWRFGKAFYLGRMMWVYRWAFYLLATLSLFLAINSEFFYDNAEPFQGHSFAFILEQFCGLMSVWCRLLLVTQAWFLAVFLYPIFFSASLAYWSCYCENFTMNIDRTYNCKHINMFFFLKISYN